MTLVFLEEFSKFGCITTRIVAWGRNQNVGIGIATQNDDKNNVGNGNDDGSNNVIHHMNEDECVNVYVSSVNGLSS